MKKLITLFVLLVPVILFSQVQPVASSKSFKSAHQFGQISGNRSIPPGTLVWSQPPDCDGFVWACQMEPNYPFDARVVDDFLFTAFPGQITAVRWWIGWFNPAEYSAPSSFNIMIFDDNNCLPGNTVAAWTIPFAEANEDAACLINSPGSEYWATLNPPFIPVPGQHYWIVTQPVMGFPPQTGIPPSITENLCPARQNFPLIGINWENLERDIAFELYSAEEVPVSTWALLLGGVLIAAVIFFRYRRSS